MKNKKSAIWLIVWIVMLALASVCSMVYQIDYALQNGSPLQYPPYTDFQIILLVIFPAFILIPCITLSLYYAIKESNKTIKIISSIVLAHHIICCVGVLCQM